MSNKTDAVKSAVQMVLFSEPMKTQVELRSIIRSIANTPLFGLDEEQIERVAREIEHSYGISAGLGAVVDREDFKPWLDDEKSSIEPFYWERYRQLLLA